MNSNTNFHSDYPLLNNIYIFFIYINTNDYIEKIDHTQQEVSFK